MNKELERIAYFRENFAIKLTKSLTLLILILNFSPPLLVLSEKYTPMSTISPTKQQNNPGIYPK